MPVEKRVSFSDEYGMNRDFTVNDTVWNHVRALVESNNTSANPPTFQFGIYQQPSMTSLPSRTLQHSSQTSFGSTASQTSTAQQNIPP